MKMDLPEVETPEDDLGETRYLAPDEAGGETVAMPGGTEAAAPSADEPLDVRPGSQHWSEEPGETRFMNVPSPGEAFPVISEDDLEQDGLNPLYDDSYAAPDYQNLSHAEAVPVTGGVPEEPRERRRRRRVRKLLSFLLLLLVLGLVAGVAWYTWDQELWGGVRVPDVVGETEGEARSQLTVKGLSATVEEVPADGDFGVVLSTEPAAGERCRTSDAVVLRIAVERHVPDVVGLTEEEARAQLEEAGVTDIAVEYQSSTTEEGTVLAVSPEAGETFVSGDTVTLTVAQPYTVPDVIGLSKDDAAAAIEEAGLTPEVEYAESGEGGDDKVISVSPDVGTVVERGATVTITVPIPYPSSPNQLLGYFSLTPQQVSSYLKGKGFTLEQGGTYSGGKGFGRWADGSGNRVYFTSQPETIVGPVGTSDVLADGADWDAVRYDPSPGSSVGTGAVSEENARALATSCGLGSGISRICTQTNITTPYSIDRSAYDFVCLEGTEGGHVWVVLLYRAKGGSYTTYEDTTTVVDVQNEDGTVTRTTTTEQTPTITTVPADTYTTAVVAAMPAEIAQVSGLSSFGGHFADYFAYAIIYSS